MFKYIICLGEIQGLGNMAQACKPGSVSVFAKQLSRLASPDDDHLSSPGIAARIMQPTRLALTNGPLLLARPIWFCSA